MLLASYIPPIGQDTTAQKAGRLYFAERNGICKMRNGMESVKRGICKTRNGGMRTAGICKMRNADRRNLYLAEY